MPRLLLALALLLLASSAQASDCLSAPSIWANWRGSLFWFNRCSSTPLYPTGYVNTDGVYIGNEQLIPSQCKYPPNTHPPTAPGTIGIGGRVDDHNITLTSGAYYVQGCGVSFRGVGRIIDKTPKQICMAWEATMPSGQVKTGAGTFWFVQQGANNYPPGPWVWASRPRHNDPECVRVGHVVHGPQRFPNPPIPRPPIQPPPAPSPSPYVK